MTNILPLILFLFSMFRVFLEFIMFLGQLTVVFTCAVSLTYEVYGCLKESRKKNAESNIVMNKNRNEFFTQILL